MDSLGSVLLIVMTAVLGLGAIAGAVRLWWQQPIAPDELDDEEISDQASDDGADDDEPDDDEPDDEVSDDDEPTEAMTISLGKHDGKRTD